MKVMKCILKDPDPTMQVQTSQCFGVTLLSRIFFFNGPSLRGQGVSGSQSYTTVTGKQTSQAVIFLTRDSISSVKNVEFRTI